MAFREYGNMPGTAMFNMSGQPAMSVPLAWNKAELPLGMMFSARFGDEGTLFRRANSNRSGPGSTGYRRFAPEGQNSASFGSEEKIPGGNGDTDSADGVRSGG
jgi:hypothetical protein